MELYIYILKSERPLNVNSKGEHFIKSPPQMDRCICIAKSKKKNFHKSDLRGGGLCEKTGQYNCILNSKMFPRYDFLAGSISPDARLKLDHYAGILNSETLSHFSEWMNEVHSNVITHRIPCLHG